MGQLVRLATSVAAIGQGASVLGESQARIPVGGKIKAGIKVLTSTAAKYPKALEIYADGQAAGKTWDEIEKRIKEACGLDRSPLTPRNVPYFTARRGDFAMPEVADMILDRFGEDRGDGRRLYRFPIVLPLESWLGNMPHGLKCYAASGLQYWSEYGPDGSRYCHTRGAIEMDPRAKRASRVFGGRPVILRPDTDGRCLPDTCPEYQAAKCKLAGGLIFYIPGIPGSSAIELPSTSFYSMSQWRQQMEMVGFLRGRVSGMESGKPIFYLAKRQEEVPMIDPETGKPKRVKQWLVRLEADIDMSRVIGHQEDLPQLAGEAAAMLTVASRNDDPEPEVQQKDPEPVRLLRRQVFAATQAMGLATNEFSAYAARMWGENWSHDSRGLKAALDDLDQGKTNPDDYRMKIAVPF